MDVAVEVQAQAPGTVTRLHALLAGARDEVSRIDLGWTSINLESMYTRIY